MKTDLIVVTWNHSDTLDISKSMMVQSFLKYNSKDRLHQIHFDRRQYSQLECEFSQKFGYQYEFLLYRIFLLENALMALHKEKQFDQIVFCDSGDVTCQNSLDSIKNDINLNEYVVFGSEKNQWPNRDTKNNWPGYKDYNSFDFENRFFVNGGVILTKPEAFCKLLSNCIEKVFPQIPHSTHLVCYAGDQGAFTFFYNNLNDSSDIKIKLDYPNFLAINTFATSVNDYYLENSKVHSKSTNNAPCFIHDNGWDHGCPRLNHAFELKRFYLDGYAHLKDLSKNCGIPQSHKDYLVRLKEEFNFTPTVVWDVGACVLEWTTLAKQIWPDVQSVLFEATEETEELYKETNNRYCIGVFSDVDNKEVTFYKNLHYPGGNSYYMENPAHSGLAQALFGTPANQFQRKTITLDTAQRLHNFPMPDLLKIDVQGCEIDILKGASNVLKYVKHLIVELQHIEYNIGAELSEHSVSLIENMGFKLITPKFSLSSHADADYHFIKL
jgi:FkbM family methyltransferase